MALSRHDEVLAEMRVALELDNDNPRALALKGEALLRKGDAMQAHDVLARAVSAAPSDTGIRNLYGEARRIREGGADAPPPLAPPPRAGPTSGAWAAASTPGAPRSGAAKGDRSGTIEIDPDIEGVEVETSASRTGTLDLPTEVSEESDAGIELQTGDLIRESLHESGAAFDSTDGPFRPRSSPSQRAPHAGDVAGAGVRTVGSHARAAGPCADAVGVDRGAATARPDVPRGRGRGVRHRDRRTARRRAVVRRARRARPHRRHAHDPPGAGTVARGLERRA